MEVFLFMLLALPVLYLYRLYAKESVTAFLTPASVERGVAPPVAAFVFPSVEERVKYYMGDWYYPNTTTMLEKDVCQIIKYWDNGMLIKGSPYLFDQANLRKMKYDTWGKLPWRYERGYSADAIQFHFKLVDAPPSFRMLMQFGDAFDDASFLSTKCPLMVKSRLANYNSRYDTKGKFPPILGLSNQHRHYELFPYVARYWEHTPWNEKKNAILWRGASSGKRLQVIERYFDYPRQNIDVGFSSTLAGHDHLHKYVRGDLDVGQQLSYKYLLSLEGWCPASGLKWMLYSDSVVFMTEPSKVSWAMEDKLVPFVHYVPLKDDFSDLAEQLKWAREHDEECRSISLAATKYMEDLVTTQEAQRNTKLILQRIYKIYDANFGAALRACNITT
jgi:hypothetical protein